jgi:hypothetical protein
VLYLVLEDFVAGAFSASAGSLLDAATIDLPQLQTAGLAVVLYNSATMEASRLAFLAARGSRPSVPDSAGDLSALLLAAGAIGGSGSGITALTGDVTATGPGSAAASVVGLQGVPVNPAAPSPGFALSYDGTEWVPAIEGFAYFFGPSLTQDPTANVYQSWSDMMAAIALQPPGVAPTITVVGIATVTAGVWDLRGGTLRASALVPGVSGLTVPAGATLDNLATVADGLILELQPSFPGESLTFSATPAVQVLFVGLAACVYNSGSAPAWLTPGGGATIVLASQSAAWNAVPAPTAPIIQGAAGDIILCVAPVSLAPIPDDWISGSGSLSYQLAVNADTPALSGWSGSVVLQQEQVMYAALASQYAGQIATPPVASGGSYSCVRGDELVRVAPTGVGGISVTLPAANVCTGQTVTVKKTTSDVIDAITVSAAAGNIDGAANYALPASAYSVLSFRSDGSDWWVV